MLAVFDESQDFRDRRIRRRQWLDGTEPFGKNAGAMEPLLIERGPPRQPFSRELAALHADDVETFEAGVLTVDQAERNHVAANPADSADHHLRPDPRKLMHRGQTADENEIADLAMPPQRRRGRENHVIADLAIVTDMAAVHEVAAVADAGDAAASRAPGIHGHRFPDRAALADLKPG